MKFGATEDVERIRVIDQDPEGVRLRSGFCIVKREINPQKIGHILMAPSAIKPGMKGQLLFVGKLEKYQERIPLQSVVHIHGHARADIRLLWKKEIYDILLHDDLIGYEIAE